MRPSNPTDATRKTLLRIRVGFTVLTLALAGWIYFTQRPSVRPTATVPLELTVSNLDCHVWCPIKIDRALDSLPGIFDLHVDVDARRVTAQIDPLQVDRDVIARRLRDKGWQVV